MESVYIRHQYPLTYVDPTGQILEFANDRARKDYNDYLNTLDPDSEDYKNAKRLENSDVTYILNVGKVRGGEKKEGEVTFDGNEVRLNLDSGGPTQDASMNSRIAHEIQHGVQFDTGMFGFKKVNDRWRVIFNDVNDEVQAWNAQSRQANATDGARGNLRDYRLAPDKALFLSQRGYGGYAGELRAVINTPQIPGHPPGSLFQTRAWFFRIR